MRRLLSAPPPASRACVNLRRSGRTQKKRTLASKKIESTFRYSSGLRPTTVRDGVRVEPPLTDLFFGARVVLFVHGAREQKLLPPLRSVDFRGTAAAGRISMPSSLSSAMIRDPSSIPKRRRASPFFQALAAPRAGSRPRLAGGGEPHLLSPRSQNIGAYRFVPTSV